MKLIQDAMESIRSSKCIIAALEPDALNLMMNPIGYNVVVACFTNLSYESNLCFIQAGVSNFDGLAFHATGCRILELVIEKAEGHIRDKLFEKIASRFIDLAMNCSGNYLVQHAVYLNEPGFNTLICETLVEHLRGLSLDRYGHYVVRKFLQASSRETAHRVVQAIIMLDKHTVKKFCGNRYGKAVIKAALSVPMETDLTSQLLSALN